MSHLESRPLKRRFFTSGTFILLTLMGVGFSFAIVRLVTGLEAVTNLTNSYPWGIWIAIDVACGVALAAGGFTTAALVDIFGGKKYHALLRPAVLTAWLGYLMVAVGLAFDLGRYWNIWQPIFNWQGNSVMFELAMCVMAYLMVLTCEMAPSILAGLKERISDNEWGASILRKIERPLMFVHSLVKTILPILIVAGVVLSCMHQSSLGTLMVIAPTKLSALWHTAWLPAFFLLSAVMVGFPMVVIESLFSGKALNLKAEMELLEPLAAKIPWFIGIYAFFRLGDLFLRWEQLNFLEQPASTVSLGIEICLGLFLPFVMLMFKQVRRSRLLLFAACFMVVGGVVLNRLNVFLVGFHPVFDVKGYFPSIGEIAITVGLVSMLIFLYRFFVNYFPILPVVEEDDTHVPVKGEEPIKSSLAWVLRVSAVFFLLGFIVLYVTVHKTAIAQSQLTYGEVAVPSGKAPAEERVASAHQFRPEKYRNFYVLSSPLLNSRSDYYEPVRFSHRSHDALVGGDCSVCHHRISDDESDRVGTDLKEMHREIEVRIGGACISCHEDLNEKQFRKCSACHVNSNEADYRARIGLRGAYHRQCIGCHDQAPPSAYAPTDCKSCHHPLVPDHGPMTAGTDTSSPQAVTAQCLICHEETGKDLLKSAHWNWKGLTPSILGHEHDRASGLLQMMDNYSVSMRPDLVDTGRMHISYAPGSALDGKALAKPENIDCLICHHTGGAYHKEESSGGLPAAGVKLAEAAKTVGRPSRENCGQCHFQMFGMANVKHGDLEPALANPSAEIDVHMGMLDMRCQGCHKTSRHRIEGLSFIAPVTEGRVHCETCHGNTPHGITGFLSRHLDDHVRTVSCETCHIPYFAQESPTLVHTDFSMAGKGKPGTKDQYGMPAYDNKRGSLTWAKKVVPTYRWFDGGRKSYAMGDELQVSDSSGAVELNQPLGEKHIPEARIFPFKVHSALQPYDTEKNILVAVKFKNAPAGTFEMAKAIEEGMKAVGREYSGKFGFIKTRMYTSIHHGVLPAPKALGCADCHSVKAVTCTRCHKKAEGMTQPSHTRMVYPGTKKRLDFEALGYEDDPAFMGGRFYIGLGRGKPPR
ncbi:MAG: Ni/Fe-hydrogenase cytochrome b subunit [bacterium]|nr:Ni/Fe-hydrogenase cytochrome b subunit [bacterium]